jgi:predicted protein tyrosine phosphatase
MKVPIDPNHLILDLAMDIPFTALSTNLESTWLFSKLKHLTLQIGDTYHKFNMWRINNENHVKFVHS